MKCVEIFILTAFLTQIHHLHRISYKNLRKNFNPGPRKWAERKSSANELEDTPNMEANVTTLLTEHQKQFENQNF